MYDDNFEKGGTSSKRHELPLDSDGTFHFGRMSSSTAKPRFNSRANSSPFTQTNGPASFRPTSRKSPFSLTSGSDSISLSSDSIPLSQSSNSGPVSLKRSTNPFTQTSGPIPTNNFTKPKINNFSTNPAPNSFSPKYSLNSEPINRTYINPRKKIKLADPNEKKEFDPFRPLNSSEQSGFKYANEEDDQITAPFDFTPQNDEEETDEKVNYFPYLDDSTITENLFTNKDIKLKSDGTISHTSKAVKNGDIRFNKNGSIDPNCDAVKLKKIILDSFGQIDYASMNLDLPQKKREVAQSERPHVNSKISPTINLAPPSKPPESSQYKTDKKKLSSSKQRKKLVKNIREEEEKEQRNNEKNNDYEEPIYKTRETVNFLNDSINNKPKKKLPKVIVKKPKEKVVDYKKNSGEGFKLDTTVMYLICIFVLFFIYFVVVSFIPIKNDNDFEKKCPNHASCSVTYNGNKTFVSVGYCEDGFEKLENGFISICAPKSKLKMYLATLKAAVYVSKIDGDCCFNHNRIDMVLLDEMFPLADLELLQYDEDFLTEFVNGEFKSRLPRYNMLCRMYKNAVEEMPLQTFLIFTIVIAAVYITYKNYFGDE